MSRKIQPWHPVETPHHEATRYQEDHLVEVESDDGTFIRVPMVPRCFKQPENLIVSGHVEYEFCPADRVLRKRGAMTDRRCVIEE